jgi:hypothetical protein
MSNLATLQPAPNFTPETGREYGRLGGLASVESKRRKKADLVKACDTDQAQIRAKLQVDKVLTWMENCRSREDYAALVVTLDRLWDKAFPRQASVRPQRQRRSMDGLAVRPAPQPNKPDSAACCVKSVSGNQEQAKTQ